VLILLKAIFGSVAGFSNERNKNIPISDFTMLEKIFGVFLVLIGLKMIFKK
jgi:uncharacterized membrane protein YfcA